MQKLELRSNETLPCFIMPKYLGYKDTNSSWSYNNKIIINQENEGHYGIKKEMLEDFIENEFDVAAEQALFDCSLPRIEHHQYAFQTVMPLRELYISVPLIQHAFSTSNTVNDALQTIFDQVNDHSEKIWNIKMSTKSSDKNAITFTDANLMPPGTILSDKEDKKPVKGLIFDVFTDTSIVSNCDLKYSTPKGGLSNIIAISNTLNPQEYSTQELGALNNLLLLNKPKVKGGPDNQKFVSVRSLPIQGEVNEVISQPAINLKIDSVISQIKKSFTDADFNRRSQYDNTVDGENQNSTVSYYMDYQKSLDQRLNKVDSVVDKKGDFNPDDWETIGSFRQEKLDDARLRLFVTSGENTISPILPVELDLSVYGNRYLEIGDLYGLSYLPEHYKERTDFQIVGIQDNITPEGWTTSYTSILRVKPGKKQIVSLRSEDDKIGAGKKKRIDKNMYPEKFDQSNQKFSQSDNLQLFNERYVPKIDESKLILLSKEREFGSTATGINPADPEKTYRTLETKYFQDSYKISFEIYKYEFQPNLYPHICTGIEASWKKLSKFDNLAYAYALTKVVTKHFMPSRPVAIELGGNKTVTDYPDNYESIKNDNDFIYSLSSLGVTEMLFKVYFDDAYTNDVLLKNVIDTINNFLGDDDDIIRTHFERKMLKSAYETYVEDKTSPPGYTNIIAAKGWLSQYTDRLEADYQVRSYISDFGIRSYNLNDGETKGEYIYVVNRKFSENDQPFQNIRIPSSMLEQANITITEFCGELGQNWAELFNQLDIVKEDNDVNVADEIERETKARKERADELSKDIPITPRNTGGGLNNPQY